MIVYDNGVMLNMTVEEYIEFKAKTAPTVYTTSTQLPRNYQKGAYRYDDI